MIGNCMTSRKAGVLELFGTLRTLVELSKLLELLEVLSQNSPGWSPGCSSEAASVLPAVLQCFESFLAASSSSYAARQRILASPSKWYPFFGFGKSFLGLSKHQNLPARTLVSETQRASNLNALRLLNFPSKTAIFRTQKSLKLHM